MDGDLTPEFITAIQAAMTDPTPLNIVGGGSKEFLGRTPQGTRLSTTAHRGILNYEPSELVITARAGTTLRELEQTLAQHGQALAFEPPHFGDNATLGGAVACGLSGPRRPYAGAARDFVLGCRLINGRGEVLHFGGEVMKNVAGYDVSRLMCGAMGTLGLLLDISLKVLPRPATEVSLAQECTMAVALARMNAWAGRPLPLSAAVYDGEQLRFRLSGADSAVKAARQHMGGEPMPEADRFWQNVREQRHVFFSNTGLLWRLSLPPAAAPSDLPGKSMIDWGGAQRWLISDADDALIRASAAAAGGHATLFRGGARDAERFHPLPANLLALHRALKQTFDPSGIFNPGRLYATL
jgi:glycolate oxidase FAD binding subunit